MHGGDSLHTGDAGQRGDVVFHVKAKDGVQEGEG